MTLLTSSSVDRWDFAKFRSFFSLIIFTGFSSPFYTHPSCTQQVDILFVSAWSSSSLFSCCFFSLKKWCMCCALLLSCVRLFASPWTVACQAPLSMRFARQGYWRGLLCPPAGDLPNPKVKPRSPALQADSLLSEPPGKPKNTGVGSLSLLQGTFPAQKSNWGLLHCRRILSQLSLPNRVRKDVATYYQEQMRGTAHKDFTPPTIQLHFSGSFCYWPFANNITSTN